MKNHFKELFLQKLMHMLGVALKLGEVGGGMLECNLDFFGNEKISSNLKFSLSNTQIFRYMTKQHSLADSSSPSNKRLQENLWNEFARHKKKLESNKVKKQYNNFKDTKKMNARFMI